MAGRSVWPKTRKIRHVSSSVAMVMPEIGLLDEPTSPVSRDETVTNRNPNSRIITAPSMPHGVTPSPNDGTNISAAASPRLPNSTTSIDRSRSVRAVSSAPAARLARRSRNPDTIEARISGSARNMLMMPPAATAPAPM